MLLLRWSAPCQVRSSSMRHYPVVVQSFADCGPACCRRFAMSVNKVFKNILEAAACELGP